MARMVSNCHLIRCLRSIDEKPIEVTLLKSRFGLFSHKNGTGDCSGLVECDQKCRTIQRGFFCTDGRMWGMKLKPGQLSLRRMFWIVTIIALYLGMVSLIERHRVAVNHETFVKSYRDIRAYYETLRSTQSAESIEKMRQQLDQEWKDRHQEPVPDFP